MAEERTIHLYPYQVDMVNRIEKAFESFRSVMVQMPTGTGKTHVIAAIARKFVSEGKTVWMVAHRRELVTQIQNTLALYLSKDEMSLVEVRSVQWLSRHLDESKASPLSDYYRRSPPCPCQNLFLPDESLPRCQEAGRYRHTLPVEW